jgi:hypothetical protein
LPSKHEALSSIPSTAKKERREGGRKEGRERKERSNEKKGFAIIFTFPKRQK